MNIKEYLKKIKNQVRLKRGSALLLSLLIITSIIVIAMGGSAVALSGLKMAGIQSQSVKAYFAAEAGAERLLYEIRKDDDSGISFASPLGEVISETELNDGSSYWVKFASKANGDKYNTFVSLGAFLKTRRSVDLRF